MLLLLLLLLIMMMMMTTLHGDCRWAVKQEKLDNIGQWKHTQVENTEWNKQALSWPVTPDGQLNDNYDWPMEGYLLAYAPPTKCHGEGSTDNSSSSSLRLQVLKNGCVDSTMALPVVAPVCDVSCCFTLIITLTHTCLYRKWEFLFSHSNGMGMGRTWPTSRMGI